MEKNFIQFCGKVPCSVKHLVTTTAMRKSKTIWLSILPQGEIYSPEKMEIIWIPRAILYKRVL